MAAPLRRPPPDSAASFVPDSTNRDVLAAAANECRGCDLYARATRAVFGRGPERVRVMLVGEQPGDVEDREGVPFVGPAGRVLDRALDAAGLERTRVYVTNAVKHFSFEARGTRRIHKKPTFTEVRACKPWLDAELQLVRPKVLVLLGATAAQSVIGPEARVNALRGRVLSDVRAAPSVIVTIHPSAVLRADDREGAFASLVADLEVAVRAARR